MSQEQRAQLLTAAQEYADGARQLVVAIAEGRDAEALVALREAGEAVRELTSLYLEVV